MTEVALRLATPRTDAAEFDMLSSLQSGTEKVVKSYVAQELEVEMRQESIIRAALQIALTEKERELTAASALAAQRGEELARAPTPSDTPKRRYSDIDPHVAIGYVAPPGIERRKG